MTGRNRGAPRKATVPINLRISALLLSTLKSERPTLLNPTTKEFRHGALGGYVEQLLWKELRGKPKYEAQSKIISDSLAGGGGPPDRAEGGTGPARSVHGEGPASGGDSLAEGSVRSPGESNEGSGKECLWPNCACERQCA